MAVGDDGPPLEQDEYPPGPCVGGMASREAGWPLLGVTHTGVVAWDGEETGVRADDSVILSRNISICFSVRALCRVSRGRILGTRQPSSPWYFISLPFLHAPSSEPDFL